MKKIAILFALLIMAFAGYSQQVVNSSLTVKGNLTGNKDIYFTKFPAVDTNILVTVAGGKVDTLTIATLRQRMGIKDSVTTIYDTTVLLQVDTIYSIQINVDTIYSIVVRTDTIHSYVVTSDTIYSIVVHADTIYIGNDTITGALADSIYANYGSGLVMQDGWYRNDTINIDTNWSRPTHNHLLDNLSNVRTTGKTNRNILYWDGVTETWRDTTWSSGVGTVTSVALSLPSDFTISGSPVTGSGTLTATWASRGANLVLASPNGSSGSLALRKLYEDDIVMGNNTVFIGNASSVAKARTLSGDIVTTNTGTVTIQPNAVQGTDISLTGEVNGDVMYFNGTDWIRLGIGAAGKVLKANGTIPYWGNDSTGAGLTATNGVDNRLATFSSATSLNGESGLTYDGTTLQITGGKQTISNNSSGYGMYVLQGGNNHAFYATSPYAMPTQWIENTYPSAGGSGNAILATSASGSAIDAQTTSTTYPAIKGWATGASGTGVESKGNLRITEQAGVQTNYVQFRTPSISSDYTYTLPSAYPTINGQVLSATTAGDMSWSNQATGTVTAVATGYGLTGGTITTSGTLIADSTKLATQYDIAGFLSVETDPIFAADSAKILHWSDTLTKIVTQYDIRNMGTVTSVGLSMPAQFTVTNSPVTTSGTLTAAWTNQTERQVLRSPISGSGAPTFGKVTPEYIQQSNGYVLIGQTGNAAGEKLISGDATLAASGVLTISDNAVDGTDISLASEASGDVMYFNGTDWVRLAAGMSGKYLQTQGIGAPPQWSSVSNGTVTSVATGYGLSGGTITTTGTLVADTSKLATQYDLLNFINNDTGYLETTGDTAYGNYRFTDTVQIREIENRYGNLWLRHLPRPDAPTATLNVTSGNLSGQFYYRVSFLTANGESELSDNSNLSDLVSNEQITVEFIPTGEEGVVIGRNIYRVEEGNYPDFLLIATINDNTTTTYSDNNITGTLPIPQFGTATGGIFVSNDTILAMIVDEKGGLNMVSDTNSFRMGVVPYRMTSGEYPNSSLSNHLIMEKQLSEIGKNGLYMGVKGGRYYSMETKGDDEQLSIMYSTGGYPLIESTTDTVIRIVENNLQLPELASLSSTRYLTQDPSTKQIGYSTISTSASVEDTASNSLWRKVGNVLYPRSATSIGLGSTLSGARVRVNGNATSDTLMVLRNSKTGSDSAFVVTPRGYVGIGTAAPTTALQVVGTITGTLGNFSQMFSGTYQPTSGNPIVFKNSGGTELARISTTGFLGLNTTTPTSRLHLYGNKTADTLLKISNSRTGNDSTLYMYSNGEVVLNGSDNTSGALGLMRVEDNSADGTAIFADALSGGNGIWGDATTGVGVLGYATSGYGISGSATSGRGLSGLATTGAGVHGASTDGIGVYGESTNSFAGSFAGKFKLTGITEADSAKYILTWNKATGEVKAMDEPGHFYGYYSNNTGFTRAFTNSNTYYPLVVAMTFPETHGFTADNDTAKVTYNYPSGHVKFDIKVSLTGNTGNDIELQLFNATDNAEVPTSQITTVDGGSNMANLALTCYDINASAGDVYQLRVRNISATSTVTVYRIMWFGQVIHY